MFGEKLIMQVSKRLRDPDAPRIVTHAMLERLADHLRPGVAKTTVARLAEQAEGFGMLVRTGRGRWVNRLTDPPASPEETIPFLRRGAVVSLATVLGDAGVLNNWTPDIQCVVPVLHGSPRPAVTPAFLDGLPGGRRAVTFRVLPMAVLHPEAARPGDIFDKTVRHPRATPEAALCHWLYLAASPYSTLAAPTRGDVDLDHLDETRLRRLTRLFGLETVMAEWAGDDTAEVHYSASLGF